MHFTPPPFLLSPDDRTAVIPNASRLTESQLAAIRRRVRYVTGQPFEFVPGSFDKLKIEVATPVNVW